MAPPRVRVAEGADDEDADLAIPGSVRAVHVELWTKNGLNFSGLAQWGQVFCWLRSRATTARSPRGCVFLASWSRSRGVFTFSLDMDQFFRRRPGDLEVLFQAREP